MCLKQIATTLHHQTEILQSILDSIGEGVVVADENGKFLLFNPAAEKLTGIGATESQQEEWSERYGIFKTDTTTPYSAQEVPLAKAIRGEATTEEELFIRNSEVPEGVFLSVTGRPLKDEKGVLKDVVRRGNVMVFNATQIRRRMRTKPVIILPASKRLQAQMTYSMLPDQNHVSTNNQAYTRNRGRKSQE